MATTLDFITYVCEQLDGCGSIRNRKMFGEYMVYVNDKPLFTVCDNCVYVKMLPALGELLADAPRGCPYDGAKECYIVDADDRELLQKVVSIAEPIIPLPKNRAPKK